MNNGTDDSQVGDSRKTEPKQEMLASKTVLSAAWLMGGRLFSRSIGILSTLILARVLLPGDFGIVAMANTFSAILDSLSQIGIQDALVRRKDDSRDLFDTAFTLQAGRGVITCFILAVSGPLASWWFGEPRLVYIMVALGATALVGSLENVGISEFRRDMRFGMVVSLLTVPRFLAAAVAVTAALLLKSYWALLIGGGASAIIRTTISYVVHPYRPRLSLAGWRKLAGFSFWIWASSIATILWERIDVFVLGPVLGQARMGLYVIAWELGSLPNTEIVAPASDALFAGFSRAQRGTAGSAQHAPQVAAMLVAVIAPITITISCASGYIVAALLGPHWAAAVPLVSITAWLCLFAPLSAVCNVVLVADGRVGTTFTGKAAATAIKLVVLIAATAITRRIELIAAAVTLCVAVESCGYLFLISRLPQVRLQTMLGPLSRILLAGSMVIFVLYKLGLAWRSVTMSSLTSFAYLAALAILVAALYTGFVLALWYLVGRPAGPEQRLLELCRSVPQALALRFSRRQES